jgi:hydroxymethylbilane synthase
MADQLTRNLIEPLHHKATAEQVLAERALNRRLEGGCQVPIACYAIHKNGGLWLRGLVASIDGKQVIYDEISGQATDGEILGVRLAEQLLNAGADAILKAVYEASND